MCCLKYEDVAYEDLVKKAPKVDAFVETPSGKGTVINVNLLRGNAKVRLEEGLDTTLKTFKFDELSVLGGKGRRAEYIAAKAEGRLQEAGFTVTPPPEPKPATEAKPAAEPFRRPKEQHAASAPQGNASNQRKQNSRPDRKPPADIKKKQAPSASDHIAGEGEKAAKPAQKTPSDGTASKKPYTKRYRGGRGKK